MNHHPLASRLSILVLAIAGLAACGDDSGGGGGAGGAGGGATSGGDGGGGAAAASTGTTSSTTTTTSSGATTGSTGGAGGDGAGGQGGGGGGGEGGSGGAGSGGDGGGGGVAADGYGAISGTCGAIDLRDLQDPAPSYLENAIDLTGEPPITMDDPSALTPGSQEMIADGNLGGSSVWSEVFAYEVLARCDGAELVKTEGEIVYATEGKKTDILLAIDGEKVGVSVVRAVGFPPEDPYTVAEALPVLEGKLDDILQSSANVAPEDAWVKQILAVVAYSDEHAQSMRDAWDMLDEETRADTIVLVTVTHGDDDFIYFGE